MTECRLFVLERNTWYEITVCKQMRDKIQLKKMFAMEHWKYSYHKNQTFKNESMFGIK